MMQEPKLKNKEKVISQLKPFWKKYWKKEEKLRKEVAEIAKEMSESVGLGMSLEFLHVNGECVGIGAYEIKDRKKFPLIQDSVLM